jgi:hypothetical protein
VVHRTGAGQPPPLRNAAGVPRRRPDPRSSRPGATSSPNPNPCPEPVARKSALTSTRHGTPSANDSASFARPQASAAGSSRSRCRGHLRRCPSWRTADRHQVMTTFGIGRKQPTPRVRRKPMLASLHTLEVQHAEWRRILRTGLRPRQQENTSSGIRRRGSFGLSRRRRFPASRKPRSTPVLVSRKVSAG